jgi:hypothetical protein
MKIKLLRQVRERVKDVFARMVKIDLVLPSIYNARINKDNPITLATQTIAQVITVNLSAPFILKV